MNLEQLFQPRPTKVSLAVRLDADVKKRLQSDAAELHLSASDFLVQLYEVFCAYKEERKAGHE